MASKEVGNIFKLLFHMQNRFAHKTIESQLVQTIHVIYFLYNLFSKNITAYTEFDLDTMKSLIDKHQR